MPGILDAVIIALAVAVLFVALAAVRVLGTDGNKLTACALALIPYWVVAGAGVGVVMVILGWWWLASTLLAGSVVLATGLVARVVPAPTPKADGPRLRVMAANLLFGRGDVKTVVELVHTHDVDVLNLLELTAECAEELARAGLFDVLPHQFPRPAPGGRGSAVLSRHPLTELALVESTRLAQPSARIDVDGIPVEVVAVHPVPPTQSAPVWQAELGRLPTPLPAGPVRILAGDFNATADHAAFRRLLRAGYVDAAQQRGSGLRRTWRLGRFPLVALDHVLVDSRAGVAAFRVLDIPGSDHKAVFADIVLPEPR